MTVHPVPGDLEPEAIGASTAVVIDVLRATTTACFALAAGAEALIPVAEPGEAFALRERLSSRRPLLCGEREGVRIPGFDLGNSPLEYVPAAVGGRVLVQCSTNGTGAMVRCAGARRVLLASFANAAAVVAVLRGESGPVDMVCSGKEGRPCAEDLALAGRLAGDLEVGSVLGAAAEAREAWREARGDIAGFLAGTGHGSYLASLGFAGDFAPCAGSEAVALVPELVAANLEAFGRPFVRAMPGYRNRQSPVARSIDP